MKRYFTRCIVLCAVMAVALVVWEASAEQDVYAEGYYDSDVIYTEGIYVAEGLYIEPCFEHFKSEGESFPALKVEGDMPKGTEYNLYIQVNPEEESIQSSEYIPTISDLGVYLIEVLMPDREPVLFQAEIVLEGIKPCRETSMMYDNGELKEFPCFEFTNEYSRPTYNIDRGKTTGGVPSSESYEIVMHKFSNPSETYSNYRKLKGIRAHTLCLDISGGSLKTPLKQIHVGTQVYSEYYYFASHEEMLNNRTTYGE